MPKKVFIIGCGALGASLGLALHRAGRDILGIYDIDARAARTASERIGVKGFGGSLPEMIKDAQTVIVTVPDDAIATVAQQAQAEELCAPHQIWIHCSGHLNYRVFSVLEGHVAGMGTMHPAHVFPPRVCTDIPENVYFAVGGNPAGIEMVQELVSLMKGRVLLVDPSLRPIYHAAMVMGSNYVVALLASARDVLSHSGISEGDIDGLLFGLAQSAISRSRSLGLDHSLSGPVRRGDVGVVGDHVKVLAPWPDLQHVYVEMGKATVRLAARQPGYCPDTAETILEVFERVDQKR